MRQSAKGNPIHGFAPSEIRLNVTALDVTDIEGIRLSTESEYYIGTDSANKAMMPAGVTIIDTRINRIVFTTGTTVEIMKP